MGLRRHSSETLTVAVGTSAAASTAVNFSEMAGGMVFIPAGSSITSLAWYAAPSVDGTFLPVLEFGTALTTTVAAGRAVAVPSAVFGCGAFKVVGDAAGTVLVGLKG